MTDDMLGKLLLVDVLQPVHGDVLQLAGAGMMGVVGVAILIAKRWPAMCDRLGKEVGKVTDGAA